MGVNPARGQNFAFTCNNLGACANSDGDIGLNIGVARLANRPNSAVFDRHIGFINPGIIQNKRVGNHGVSHLSKRALPLPHAITNHFATTKFDLFTIAGKVFFHFEPQLGISQTQFIAHG